MDEVGPRAVLTPLHGKVWVGLIWGLSSGADYCNILHPTEWSVCSGRDGPGRVSTNPRLEGGVVPREEEQLEHGPHRAPGHRTSVSWTEIQEHEQLFDTVLAQREGGLPDQRRFKGRVRLPHRHAALTTPGPRCDPSPVVGSMTGRRWRRIAQGPSAHRWPPTTAPTAPRNEHR